MSQYWEVNQWWEEGVMRNLEKQQATAAGRKSLAGYLTFKH